MKDVIKRYISNLTIDDIKTYAKNKGCVVKEEECKIIYRYIKTYYENLLNKDDSCFNELKKEINPDLYKIIVDLYNKYKDYF